MYGCLVRGGTMKDEGSCTGIEHVRGLVSAIRVRLVEGSG
jgi:hypothetical protein